MKVKIINAAKEREHCNFCRRASFDGYKMIYPYDIVFQISKEEGGLVANVCPRCVNDLFEAVTSFTAPAAQNRGR